MTRFGMVLAALVGGTPALAAAGDSGAVSVVQQAFCIQRAGTRCEEVALPGARVPYERLPQRSDGTRVVYFYSDQRGPGPAVLVHALESEDADSATQVIVDPALKSQAAALQASLEGAAAGFTHGGAVTLRAFAAGGPGKNSRVFSEIAIGGPGVVSGLVVDAQGHPAAPGERLSFTVTRGPAGEGHAPTSGMKSYEGDG